MKIKVKKNIILVLAICMACVGVFSVKSGLVDQVLHIGNSRSEAIENLLQLLSKEGIVNTVKIILVKLKNDPRLGLDYSLGDKNSYPTLENQAARDALPEFKVIPSVDVSTLPPSINTGNADGSWSRSNGDDGSTKYSNLQQINNGNVKSLELAWFYSSANKAKADRIESNYRVETNPVIANGRIFVSGSASDLISLDAESGREIWRAKLPPPVARRGLVWDKNSDFSKSRLFVPTGRGVYAISAATGEVQKNFGSNGQVGDQMSLIAPVIAGENLIVALIKPVVEAYDLRNGQLIWSRPLLEKPTQDNALLTGGSPWGGMSFDAARSIAYVSTGNPRPELLGTSRRGENRHSSSVVAINTKNGEIIWSFQEVSHDLWDLDVPSPPVLAAISYKGRKVDVVAVPTKIGNTLLLDRDFGKPIFDYRLKRAPVSKVPGEETSPYQPLLELPEPFLKQTFELSDVTDISYKDRQSVLNLIRGAKLGFYEPPVIGGKVVMFGIGGGAEWPGGALDPKKGILFVPSNHNPWIIRANYRDLGGGDRRVDDIPGNDIYQSFCSHCHGEKRDGRQEIASKGGHYFPSLVGITFHRTRDVLVSEVKLKDIHNGIGLTYRHGADLERLFDYFSRLDQIADKEGSIGMRTFWWPLTDISGNPGSRPPWGLLTALDLNTGKKVWQIPFGVYKTLRRNGEAVKGQTNVGGVIATAGGIVFATGTLDAKVRAFDSTNGRELWTYDLPGPGTAPPSTYQIKGKQYLTIVSNEEILTFKIKNKNLN